ncbi:pyrimidine 5'-nucleotidase [Aestuariivirga litoralis]|uniref:pyrimidine 5'-nucleotidase n=1 Tax=Aestuariivirga litoralis TaxID=2650924 RepID=UPI0018C84BA7|nr:pyrimidine 5'-nucleotidase [Aestuariivirga litoralis]MBG1232759.1 pyrimidine 5'-nucleotidase [Aestuariivirga litoralis]
MSKLAHIDTWIFDLDNTLYPPSCKLFDQIAERMNEYIIANMGLSREAAIKLRHVYFKKYGTTLRGLMLEHGWEPTPYLEYVHEIDYDAVKFHPGLKAAIENLPGRKLVFTAGTRAHARNVLKNLDCSDTFEDIFDIHDAGFIPKPSAEPYELFLTRHGITPERSIFFEDIVENLIVPRAMGMKTVLVGRQDEALLPAHVDYVTADLAEFLNGALK